MDQEDGSFIFLIRYALPPVAWHTIWKWLIDLWDKFVTGVTLSSFKPFQASRRIFLVGRNDDGGVAISSKRIE